MKATDILKKAEEIEKKWIIIEKETKNNYGVAVKLSGDPEIKIAYYTKDSDNQIKPRPDNFVCIDVKNIDKLIKAIDELLKMDL